MYALRRSRTVKIVHGAEIVYARIFFLRLMAKTTTPDLGQEGSRHPAQLWGGQPCTVWLPKCVTVGCCAPKHQESGRRSRGISRKRARPARWLQTEFSQSEGARKRKTYNLCVKVIEAGAACKMTAERREKFSLPADRLHGATINCCRWR